MTLTVGSLFSGIGGLDLGLERAGMNVRWQCEIDPYCQKVLKKHWPEVVLYDDVTKLRGSDVERVDVLCGGFPCQDVSTAGKRVGIKEGTRSGLWAEYARLIGEIEPRWVVIENVPGLLSIDAGRGMGKVLYDLAVRGYDAEWDCISAASVGALHRRDRIFIVGHLADPDWSRCEVGIPNRCEKETSGRNHNVSESSGIGGRGRPLRRNGEPSDIGPLERGWRDNRLRAFSDASREWWAIEPDVGRVANGVPSRVDRLRALGNAVVPQVAEHIGRLIVVAEGGGG